MSTHNIYNEECLTCRSYILDNSHDRMCDRLNDPRGIDCPCGKCLVKSMCKSGCSNYHEFWNANLRNDLDRMRREDKIG